MQILHQTITFWGSEIRQGCLNLFVRCTGRTCSRCEGLGVILIANDRTDDCSACAGIGKIARA